VTSDGDAKDPNYKIRRLSEIGAANKRADFGQRGGATLDCLYGCFFFILCHEKKSMSKL
jgi:hypothetical protein